MKEFNLFGYSLKFDDNFELFNKYMVECKKLINNTRNEISKKFKANSSVEEFIISTILIRDTYLDDIIDIYFEHSKEWGLEGNYFGYIPDIYGDTKNKFDAYITTLLIEYISIIEIYNELEVNRYLEQLNIKRWQGGGFGVKNAIKGALTADAMNKVTDFLYNIKDASIASSNNKKIEELKSKLIKKYRDNFIFEKLIDEYIYVCFNKFLHELIDHNKIKLTNLDLDTDEAMQIYNNLVVNENNHKIKLENSIKCISKYPYEIIFYEELYATDPRNLELDNIIKFFGLSETKLCLEYKKKYTEIDIKERTFNDKTYETKEERIFVEKEYIKNIKEITKYLDNRFKENNIKLDNFDSLEKYHECLDIVEFINEKYDLNILTLLDTTLIKDNKWVEKSNLSNDVIFIKNLKNFLHEFNKIEEDIKLYKNKLNNKRYLDDDKKKAKSHFRSAIFFSILTFIIFFFTGINIFVIFFALVSISNFSYSRELKKGYKKRNKEMKSNYYKYNDKHR